MASSGVFYADEDIPVSWSSAENNDSLSFISSIWLRKGLGEVQTKKRFVSGLGVVSPCHYTGPGLQIIHDSDDKYLASWY